LVLTVAGVNVALGLFASEAAARRDDDRTFLVSMALLASAGFLGLHALATPGVLLDHTTGGFSVAARVGLLLAAGFARTWHAMWWEWHVLMAVAFGAILVAARLEYRREGSLTAVFAGIYLDRTLRGSTGTRLSGSRQSSMRSGPEDRSTRSWRACARKE